MDIFLIEQNFLYSLFLFVGYLAFYKFFNIDKHIDVRINSRVISLLACSAMIYGATWSLWYDNFTKMWSNVVVTGIFYTLLDFYFVAFNYDKFKSIYWEILLHHVILFYIFLNHQLGVKLLAFGLYVESSTILLNIGWFMIKAGMQKTLIFKINSIFIWITYLIFRVIGLPIILLIAHTNCWIKVAISPLIILNWYWFGKLTEKFVQLIRGDQIKVE